MSRMTYVIDRIEQARIEVQAAPIYRYDQRAGPQLDLIEEKLGIQYSVRSKPYIGVRLHKIEEILESRVLLSGVGA